MAVTDPSQAALQFAFALFVERRMAEGSVMLTEAVTVQPFVSVTTTEYVPADNPVAFAVV